MCVDLFVLSIGMLLCENYARSGFISVCKTLQMRISGMEKVELLPGLPECADAQH
jgi:hypothetical protein